MSRSNNRFATVTRTLFFFLSVSFLSVAAYAQDESGDEEEIEFHGFKRELLFTGGTLNLSLFNGTTVLGATPQLGYNIASWLDAGLVFGYTYSSQRDFSNNKIRQTIIGPGAFVRIFPINFLFITSQFEHNFVRLKAIPSFGTISTYKYNVSSLLLGAGYTSGREGRNSPYYFFSVSVDVLKNINSPYKDQYNNLIPVVNAGLNIPLFQGGGKRRRL